MKLRLVAQALALTLLAAQPSLAAEKAAQPAETKPGTTASTEAQTLPPVSSSIPPAETTFAVVRLYPNSYDLPNFDYYDLTIRVSNQAMFDKFAREIQAKVLKDRGFLEQLVLGKEVFGWGLAHSYSAFDLYLRIPGMNLPGPFGLDQQLKFDGQPQPIEKTVMLTVGEGINFNAGAANLRVDFNVGYAGYQSSGPNVSHYNAFVAMPRLAFSYDPLDSIGINVLQLSAIWPWDDPDGRSLRGYMLTIGTNLETKADKDKVKDKEKAKDTAKDGKAVEEQPGKTDEQPKQ